MAEGYVQVNPDSTGKKLRMEEVTVGANLVEMQVGVLANSAGDLVGGDVANGLDVDVTRLPAITGTVAVSNLPATQPVSATALPLPTGASTEATLALIKAKTDNIDVALSTRTKPADAQHTIIDSGTAAVTGTFWQATQPVSIAATVTVDSELTTADLDTGAGTDTRAIVGLALAESGGGLLVGSAHPLPVSGTFFQGTQPVSGTVTANAGTNLNTSALALDATVGTTNTQVGGLTETAPATDTASSGLNGRLQRIAQRLTTLIAQIPASLGRKTKANSLAVTLASDQDALPVTGTFWQATQPVSGTVTANAGTNLNTSLLALEAGGNLATIAGAVRAEDVASADAHTGIPAMVVRKATPANTSNTDGDYEMLQISAGRLWTSATIDTALPTGANTIGALTANQSVNVAQINGVTATMGNGVSGTGVQRVTLASDSTGQVTLATGANTIGALTANQSTNIAQMNGVATTMGNGVSGTGVQRVTLASDSTGQVTLAAGAATIGALTANQSVNNAQINGVTPLMGNGVTGTGSQRVTIASDNTAFPVNATLQASENLIGKVGAVSAIVAITPTLDNAAIYAAGDVLFDSTAIVGAVRVNDGTATLQSVVLNDKDDQTAAGLDLYFLSANVGLGTRNGVPNISDANADNILGKVSLVAGDWTDLGGCKIGLKSNINMIVKPASGTTTVYVAAVTQGTPTTTTSGMTLRLGFQQD